MSYKVNIIYRDVSNLKISLNKDGLVTVISPKNLTQKEIFKILESKKAWLDKHAKRLSINQKYDYQNYTLNDSDSIYFLGCEYPIKLVESKHNIVNYHDDHIQFLLNPSVIANREFKLQLLEEFYKDQADIILNNLVAKYLKITNQEINRVTIKKQRLGGAHVTMSKKLSTLILI